ncbi:AAA-like domain-containing protein [Oxynema sp. CENA135]|uniref:AAA-like domain-containing protein n=1 Tax=Oxynema sp. CENA135 TaxID=984206 RepID=UPI00190AE5E7|nr:AAA-like domain-containing protein [Oxynema sp. CENA135]MBK4731498.1 AAA-like domain-containing protein [Oxynema sp. CENA135]
MLDFYQVGGSLDANSPYYVIRSADDRLYEELKQGNFCYLLNCRQMGKSSLLVRTFHRLQAEGYRCTSIDMSAIGSELITAEQWYKGIVADLWRSFELFRKVNLKQWWQDKRDLSPVQQFKDFIEEIVLGSFKDKNIVIFIDEIDSLLSLGFCVDDFFALIRFFYNQRAVNPEYKRLSFALFGVATPSDLIGDRQRTPFNIGRAIALDGFTLEQARHLALGFQGKVTHPEAILKEILGWTGGQPFLTQKLCYLARLALEHPADGGDPRALPLLPIAGKEREWIELLVRDRLIQNWEEQDEPEHLKTIRNRLLANSQVAACNLSLYQQILENNDLEANDSREQIELLLSGIAAKQNGRLTVKNRIYREVFDRAWVKAQLDRLRPYASALDAWLAANREDRSRLLRGRALADARLWAQDKRLSDADYQFLAASEQFDREIVQQALEAQRVREVEGRLKEQHKRLALERQNARRQRTFIIVLSGILVVAVALGICALWQYRQAIASERRSRISAIEALVSSSQALFASERNLDALVEAIAAHQALERLPSAPNPLQTEVQGVLQQALYSATEVNRFSGHRGWVLAVESSPDGQRVATGSNDRTVRLWKPDGTLLSTLPHGHTVHALAFSSDSRYLVTSNLNGMIYTWDRDGRAIGHFRAHDSAIWDVAVSPDGERIATASEDGTIALWSFQGQPLGTLKGHQGAVWGVAFSPDGKLIASGSEDRTLRIWTADGKAATTIDAHEAAVWDVEFALLELDGGEKKPTVISASADRTIGVWNPDGTAIATAKGHESEVFEIAVSTDGKQIVSASADKTVRLWTPQGMPLTVFKGHQSSIRGVTLLGSRGTIISASDDTTVRLWKPNDRFLQKIVAHRGTIWDVDYSPDGEMLGTGSTDGTLKLWTRQGRLVRSLTASEATVQGIGFLPKMSASGEIWIASANSDRTIKLWQLDGTLLKTIAGHDAGVWDITPSPRGDLLASASDDKTIKLWTREGQLLKTLVGHQTRVYDVDFTPDARRLVSASADGTIRVWSADGELLKTIDAHQNGIWQVALSPDGQKIASASLDDTIALWTIDGELVKTLEGSDIGITSIDWSADGRMLVNGGASGVVQLRDAEGNTIAVLKGHQGNVWGVAFSPDGKQIASVGDDLALILWDVERIVNLDPVVYGCDLIRDYLRTNSQLKEEQRQLCDR